MPLVRTLFQKPTLCASADGEYEEKAAEWFELLLDLVLVAACAAIADALKEDLTADGFYTFTSSFGLVITGWHAYTRFTTRFNDSSLVHSALLFVFIFAFAGMSVSAGSATSQGIFVRAASLMRLSVVLMNLVVYLRLPAARSGLFVELTIGAAGITILLCSLVVPQFDARPFYVATLFFEGFVQAEWTIRRAGLLANTTKFVIRMNIDHANEREGCFVMIVLGESVLSAVLKMGDKAVEKGWDYWVAMALTLLTIFCTALYYFDMRPPRAWHAMRRSRRGGTLFYWIHYLLQLSLLAMGVGLKFCFRALLGEAAAEGETGCRLRSPWPKLDDS